MTTTPPVSAQTPGGAGTFGLDTSLRQRPRAQVNPGGSGTSPLESESNSTRTVAPADTVMLLKVTLYCWTSVVLGWIWGFVYCPALLGGAGQHTARGQRCNSTGDGIQGAYIMDPMPQGDHVR